MHSCSRYNILRALVAYIRCCCVLCLYNSRHGRLFHPGAASGSKKSFKCVQRRRAICLLYFLSLSPSSYHSASPSNHGHRLSPSATHPSPSSTSATTPTPSHSIRPRTRPTCPNSASYLLGPLRGTPRTGSVPSRPVPRSRSSLPSSSKPLDRSPPFSRSARIISHGAPNTAPI